MIKVNRKMATTDMDLDGTPIAMEIKVEADMCFICLKDTSAIGLDRDREHRDKVQGNSACESVKILTSYILQNPLSFSSDNPVEYDELQRNVLSCLNSGKASICTECLLKAEKLMALHMKLEKIKKQIRDVLMNLQNTLKSSTSTGAMGVLEDAGSCISLFQDALQRGFMKREFGDLPSNTPNPNDEDDDWSPKPDTDELKTENYSESESSVDQPDCWDESHLSKETLTDDNDSEEDVKATRSSIDDDDYQQHPQDPDPEDERKPTRKQVPHKGKPLLWDCDICLEMIPSKEIRHHLQTHLEFENYYRCEICAESPQKRTYGTYKGLVWHYLRSNHNVLMTCKLCPGQNQSTLFSREDLCVHLYEAHQINHKKLKCKYEDCSAEEFYDPLSRQKHYWKHTRNSKPKHLTCDICQKAFKDEWDLRRHGRTHAKRERLQCPSCPKVFRSRGSLLQHEQTHREDSSPNVECPQCLKMIAKNYLSRHINSVHGDDDANEEIPCDICKKIFWSASRLESHIRRIHSEEGNAQSFRCTACAKEFRTLGGLRLHRKNHHEEQELVVCPSCPKMFTKYRLQQHISRVHEGKRETKKKLELHCQFCGKTFTNTKGLARHEETHGTEKYNCPKCKYVTNARKNLWRHMIIHKEKKFKCQHCSKAFITRTYLKDHERIHSNEKQIKCDLCPMVFYSANSRNNHRRTKHGVGKANNMSDVIVDVQGAE